MSDSQDQPKIFVDEDWKSKVQAEKETAKQSGHGKPEPIGSNADSSAVSSQVESSATGSQEKPPAERAELDDLKAELPRATFTSLVTMLATQAMVALGQFPDPVQNKPVIRLNFARHYIDTLDVLEEKTKGQLTRDEAALLQHVLDDLRLAFVAAKK